MFLAGINLLTRDQKANFFVPINNLSRFWLVTEKGLRFAWNCCKKFLGICFIYIFLYLSSDFFFILVELIKMIYLIIYLAQPFCLYPCTVPSNACLNDNSECHFYIISWVCNSSKVTLSITWLKKVKQNI